MLKFENLNGFVIDLTTDDLCDEILEDILCGDDNEYKKVINYSLQGKRDYIIDYFTSTYDYVFCRSLYVYQIIEDTLLTYKDMEFREKLLRDRIEQGLQYAMSKDNKIAELNENIEELEYEIKDLKNFIKLHL